MATIITKIIPIRLKSVLESIDVATQEMKSIPKNTELKEEKTGFKIGYKPAGGISKAKDALTYLSLVKEELGDQWLSPDLFRFGASSLLGDIERQLEHYTTGVYSASYRHAMG